MRTITLPLINPNRIKLSFKAHEPDVTIPPESNVWLTTRLPLVWFTSVTTVEASDVTVHMPSLVVAVPTMSLVKDRVLLVVNSKVLVLRVSRDKLLPIAAINVLPVESYCTEVTARTFWLSPIVALAVLSVNTTSLVQCATKTSMDANRRDLSTFI